MKVIVCGAGQVGTSIVRHLAGENADVTVIDQSPELVRKIADTLDVQAMEGFASHPDVLESAGIRDADMIIAVTYSDEVNMIACQVAHSLFDVPTKIARVRHQSYLQPKWSDLFNRENMPIDSIISPELEVGRAVTRRLWVPGAFDMIPLAGGLVRVIGVRCTADTPITNTPLRQLTGLFPDLNITIVGIMRNGKGFVPDADESMLVGDEVYFVADAEHVGRAMSAFGHEEAAARRVVILGGGNIGRYIARELESHPGVSAKLIEHGKTRAEEIAQELRQTVVLNGDALDPEILEEANIGAAEAVIAVTNEDEVNILGSLLAKRAGCKRAITLINATDFTPLVSSLGIDVIVSPRAITVSTILQHIRRGRIRAVHSLGDGFGEVIEAEALETCSVTGKALKDIGFPEGVIIGAIVRGDEVINPDPDTIIKPKDRVVLFATSADVRAVEKMFSVGLAFF